MNRADEGAKLNARELQVVQAASEGLSMRATGTRMNISWHTVNDYRRRVYDKLAAVDIAHAVAICFRRGLIK